MVFFEVCIFWVYVCLVFFCFFKTDIVVFWLMLKTREMSRMPLPFIDIFTISCLVCGSAPLFVYFVWKVFLQLLHLQRGVPFSCLPIFTTFSLLQCMHFVVVFIVFAVLVNIVWCLAYKLF